MPADHFGVIRELQTTGYLTGCLLDFHLDWADGAFPIAALNLFCVRRHVLRIAGQGGDEGVDWRDDERTLAGPGFDQTESDELFDGIPDRVAGCAVVFLKILLGRQLPLSSSGSSEPNSPDSMRRRSWSAIIAVHGGRHVASFATLAIPASEIIPLVGIIHAVRRKICRTGLDSRSSGYFLHVPTVGMAWMAGCIGSILAVRLLGRASIYLMAPASQAIGLTNMSGVVLGSGQRRRAAVSSRAVRPAPAACPLVV